MSTTWDTYLPEVMMEAEGCPDALAVNYIRRAAIDFCTKTRIWREDLDPISIIANDDYCDLDPPNDSLVIAIPSCLINDADVHVWTPEELTFYRPGWRTQTTTTYPDAVILLTDSQELQLSPLPTLSYTDVIKILAALKPTRDSDSGPDLLYADWLDAITAGAKEKLLMLPNKKWTNPQLAAFHGQQYTRQIGRARIKIAKNGSDQSTPATPQPFGGV